MNIDVVITWWTIDSYFDSSTDSVKTLKQSCLPHYIDGLKTSNTYTYFDVCMKDSRELTLEDLKQILAHIEESEKEHFIVTHGTYTMPDTARYLSSNLKDSNKKVVIIGSMIPLTWFSPSDAWFNLWFAIWSLAHIKPWVYVWMNWELFWAMEVSKLISDWRFVSLFNT